MIMDVSILEKMKLPTSKTMYPKITDFISTAVNINPSAVAIQSGTKKYSYRELYATMRTFTQLFTSNGIGKGTLIAFEGIPSFDSISFLMACFSHGVIVYAFDTDLPVIRKKELVERIKPALWLFTGPIRPLDDEMYNGIPVMSIHSIKNIKVTDRTITGDDPAYIVFTSGSSGTPKAIVGNHTGLSHFSVHQQKIFRVDSNDRIALTTKPGGDPFFKEIALSMVAGATLVIPDERSCYFTNALQWMENEKITICQTVPSRYSAWLTQKIDGNQSQKALRILAFAGEPLTSQLVQRVREHLGTECKIYNFYGSTETTITKTFYEVPEDVIGGIQPVGIPLDGCEVYVVDKNFRPLKKGMQGEIVVRTPYRSRYLESEILDGFIRNPLTNDSNDVVYRTGDIGRFDNEGYLRYIGRIDDELKINGNRVHPNEVRNRLTSIEGIKDAYVIGVNVSIDSLCLAAFYCADETVVHDYVNGELIKSLPGYMLPAYYLRIESLPLMENGKVDREELKRLFNDYLRTKDIEGTQTELQQTLRTIWKEITDSDIGLHESFFTAGGHSLALVRFGGRIAEIYGVDIDALQIYENPTITNIEKVIIAGMKKEIVNEIKTEEAISLGKQYSLSFEQERLWMLDRYSKAGSAYNMPYVLLVHGDVDLAELKLTFQYIAEMHPILLSKISIEDDQPVQTINLDSPIPLYFEEWNDHDVRSEEIRKRIYDITAQTFNFDTETLTRIHALKTCGNNWIIIFNCHHIIGDAWSMGILLRDFGRIWSRLHRGEQVNKQRRVNTYLSYITKQLQSEKNDDYNAAVKLWSKIFKGMPVPVSIETDFERPQKQGFVGDSIFVTFNADIGRKVKKFATEYSATTYSVLMACFFSLIYKLTKENDIVLGTDSAGRSDGQFKETFGFFVKTLIYRISVEPGETYYEIFKKVLELKEELTRLEHIDINRMLSGGDVVLPATLSGGNLFNIMFRMFTGVIVEKNVEIPDGYTVAVLDTPTFSSKFDITVSLVEYEQVIKGEIEYNTDLYERQTIELIFNQFEKMISMLLDNPYISVDDVILDDKHPTQQTKNSYAGPWELFKSAAADHRSLPCITEGDETITYNTLMEKVDVIYDRLKKNGVTEKTLICIYGDMSIRTIATLLAAWKIKAVAVPVSTRLPQGRIDYIFGLETKPLVVYCKDNLIINNDLPGMIINNNFKIHTISGNRPQAVTDAPNDTATLFFTSGTTSMPKGIWGMSDAIGHFIAWQREQFSVSKQDRFAGLIDLSFDAVLRDILTPLCSGAQLFIPSEQVRDDAGLLIAWMKKNSITSFHAIPSIVEKWIEHVDELAPFESLKRIFLSGEALRRKLVDEMRRKLVTENCMIINFYGPSETMMIKSYYEVEKKPRFAIAPLGKSIPDCYLYIMDNQYRLCGKMEIGEICISIPYRGQSYFKSGQEDEKKFTIDPFCEGNILYHTGDRGYERFDGAVLFLGRSDEEIKLFGQRINLQQIKSHILAITGNDDFIIVTDAKNTSTRIALFYLGKNADSFDKEKIVHYLLKNIPAIAVPQQFIAIEAFPLLANGKIDVQSLRSMIQEEEPADIDSIEEETQQRIHEIWCKNLGRSRIGIDENFFTAGGNSLLATIIATQVRSSFNIHLPLATFIEHPTIRLLSEVIESKQIDVVENLSEDELFELIDK